MVAGGMIPIIIWRVPHITDNALVFCDLIDMAVKRPYRAVANGAEKEPYHEKALEHPFSIHNSLRILKRVVDSR